MKNSRELIHLYLGEYDKLNFKFVQELHATLTKTLDYYETMAQIAATVNPAFPIKKEKGVLRSTETEVK